MHPAEEYLFRYRNKTYGAYVLRKKYIRATVTGFLYSLLCMGLLIGWGYLHFFQETFKDDTNTQLHFSSPDTITILLDEPPVTHKPESPTPTENGGTQAEGLPPQINDIRPPAEKKLAAQQKKAPIPVLDSIPELPKPDSIANQGVVGNDLFGLIQDSTLNGYKTDTPELDSARWQVPTDVYEKEPMPVNIEDIARKIGYPKECLKLGADGRVIVKVQLDNRGKYVSHVMLLETHSCFSPLVNEEIKHLLCTPAIRKGKAVPCWIQIPFSFRTQL